MQSGIDEIGEHTAQLFEKTERLSYKFRHFIDLYKKTQNLVNICNSVKTGHYEIVKTIVKPLELVYFSNQY